MPREMKDSGIPWIGTIPSGWDVSTLGKFISIDSGISVGKKYESGTALVEVPYLRVANVQGDHLDLSDVATIFVTPEEAEKYKLKPGLLLMTEGGDRDKLGRGCLWNGEIENCIHQNHVFAVQTNDRLRVRYLDYLTTSEVARVYFDVTAKKTTNLACTSKSTIQKFAIPIPPVAEQDILIKYLDIKCAEIDAILEKSRASIEEYKKLRQAIITQAVTKGIRGDSPMKESGIRYIGKIPVDWDIVQLKKCVDILPGYAFSSRDFDLENGIPLLRGINVSIGEIRWEDVVYWNRPLNDSLNNFSLEENDIVVGLDRPWIADGMRVAFIRKSDLPCLLLQRVCRIRPVIELDARLIFYWISSDMFKAALSNSTTGVSVPHISTKQIEQFGIAIPPHNCDKSICDYLDEHCQNIDRLITMEEKLLSELETYKKTLIYEYVTGKKEVCPI